MLRRSIGRWCAGGRMVEEFDVVIIGGGPSGLSAAIRLKELAQAANKSFRVAVVEKGSEIGAHSLSGACIEPRSLDELLPGWRDDPNRPLTQKVVHDEFWWLTPTTHHASPILPSSLHNEGNFLGSLGAVCKYMAEKATALEVEIYPGFAASEIVYSDDGSSVLGVQLNDVGVTKKGEQGPQYQQGMIFKGKQTIFAEGCRGSCTKKLEKKFNLRPKDNVQTYGLGVKEVWELPSDSKAEMGHVLHTAGWPLTAKGHKNTYGGSFMYHINGRISCGFVVGLDYSNPHIRPYMEFQKWKTHPSIRGFFEGAKPIFYGARTLVEGGLASIPKLTFPGGVLIGDCAGFLNVAKIKGNHTAMKSGMLAAEAVFDEVLNKDKGPQHECRTYNDLFRNSWMYSELNTVRNCRQMFHYGMIPGMLYTGVTAMVTKGMEPWTLPHHPDHKALLPASQCTTPEYPKPDNVLTFDLLTNHSRSGTAHNADQPAHLKLRDSTVAERVNLSMFDGPEGKYCPAKVYEYIDGKLVINFVNCLHCKACDIKDPTQNIDWTCPEGGGGPNYNGEM